MLSVQILFINKLCCFASAASQAFSVRGKLSSSFNITSRFLSLVSFLHTHTHKHMPIQTPWPNSWWHNTTVCQNNSTLVIKYKGAVVMLVLHVQNPRKTRQHAQLCDTLPITHHTHIRSCTQRTVLSHSMTSDP